MKLKITMKAITAGFIFLSRSFLHPLDFVSVVTWVTCHLLVASRRLTLLSAQLRKETAL